MRKFSTNISALALTAVLSTSLVLSGCGDKNKSKTTVSQVKLEEIAPRKVDEAQATQALTALSLNDSGSGIISWDSKTGTGGNYTFEGVTIKGDDKDDDPVKVGTLELNGAHMEDDKVAFDRIVLNDMSTKDDDTNVTIKRIELLKPSPDLSNELARAFSGDDDAFENFEGDIGIGGFDLAGMNITGDDGVVTMDKLLFGESKDKTGMFTMKNLKMDIKDNDHVKMDIGSIDVVGFNLQKYKGFIEESMKAENNGEEVGEDAMKKIMSSLNPYAPDYKTASIKNFNVDIEGLKINMESADANTSVRKGITTINQSTSPIIITPPAQPEDRDMQEFANALTEMGYDNLVFNMSQKSILDESTDSMQVVEANIEMQDGFKLAYNYDIAGVKALMDKAALLGANNNAASNPMAAMEMMNEMTFKNLRVDLTDNSIVDRSFKLAAQKNGSTPDALKAQAKFGLAFIQMSAQDPAQQKLATDFVAAITQIIDNSGTLVLEMNPAEPVQLGNVATSAQQGDFDISTLGLSIRAE